MSKKTVAVIFGSRSTEHDVSIVTAISSVIRPLRLSGHYSVVPVYIDKRGQWFSHEKLADIATYQADNLDDFLSRLKPIRLSLGGGLQIVPAKLGAKPVDIDIVFPATHGTHGEDGELMGLLEMADIPYVGCGIEASVIAMDKVLAKTVVSAAGIPVSKFEWFSAEHFKNEQSSVIEQLKSLAYPLFVKPPHLGSSIGITRVQNETELLNAIELAAHYDENVIVEEAVANLIEVTVPVIGLPAEPQVALVEKPLTTTEDFFDFDTKYLRGGKKGGKSSRTTEGAQGYSELSAQIKQELYKRAEETARKVYTTVGCSGVARIDLLIDSKNETVYFNEINPLPGSLYAHNWRAAGVSNLQLVEQLLEVAQQVHDKKSQKETVFSTSFLSQF